MNEIKFPLKAGDKSGTVANLQDVLRLLLDRKAFMADDVAAREDLSALLKAEQAERTYGEATRKLVRSFQRERNLRLTDKVDKATAGVLNELLRSLGALPGVVNTNAAVFDTPYTVLCRTEDAKGKPIAGLRIEAFDQDPTSPHDPLGEPATTDAKGLALFRFKRSDFTEHPDEADPDLYFKVYRGETSLDYELPDIPNDKGVIRRFKQQREPIVVQVKKHYVVTGVVLQENSLPADKLTLLVHHRAFGENAPLLGTPTTDAQGRYALAYNPGAGAVNLEIRIKDPQDAQKTIPLIKPRFAAAPLEVLNLVAPAISLETEYLRLTRDLLPHLGGQIKKLVDARENAERHDLTVLNRATGWDARLIALRTITERLIADPEVDLPKEALYGLLRMGLPSDKLLLARVAPNAVEQALKSARDAGIIAASDSAVASFIQAFRTFSNRVRMKTAAPGSRSTYDELLKVSGLSPQSQGKFISVYLDPGVNAANLWDKARAARLSDQDIGKLKLQGKLAYLAGNGKEMTERLMNKQIANPVQLVNQNLYRADAWAEEVFDLARIPANRRSNLTNDDKTNLDRLIPVAYAGTNVEDRLNAYTEDMARKVRLSYPTQVIHRSLERREIELPEAHDATAKLLKTIVEAGFVLGAGRMEEFLTEAARVSAGLSNAEFGAAKSQMKTLQRVYQITPSNEAMPVLIGLGITSAYDVMTYSQSAFGKLYDSRYRKLYGKAPAERDARLVRSKAQQVSSVICNLFIAASSLNSGVPLPVISPPANERARVRNDLSRRFPLMETLLGSVESARVALPLAAELARSNSLSRRFSTMETLFGSIDFCECEHCRTVLSPAAYLVDLLQFIDPEPDKWSNFLTLWAENHDDTPYTATYQKPFDALIERRPDLPHIQLTCENTHTAMPYIDIVNEILEYYVAHGHLEDKAAHDTGGATTAELLAEPQNVITEAYDKLREAPYPLNLPFDLWLETARQFCEYSGTSLAHILEGFRQSDNLFAPSKAFDRYRIFIESLGLSPAEAAIYTDPDPLANWQQLFGFPTAEILGVTNAANATLRIANSAAAHFGPGRNCGYYDRATGSANLQEKSILTRGETDSAGPGRTIITLQGNWLVPPKSGDVIFLVGVQKTLSSAKLLSRCLSVSYKELAEIVQTSFVNPELPKLVLLYKLDVTVQDARFYTEHVAFYTQNKDLIGTKREELPAADQERFDALSTRDAHTQRTGWDDLNELDAFEQRLKDMAAEFGVTPESLVADLVAIPLGHILVLADSAAGCNFDLTTLRYADGNPADAIVFLRINLFVRLWRKLGWTIEETDRALTVLMPRSAPYNADRANLVRQPFKTALIYLAHLKALDEKLKVGKQSRLKLLTLWSDIAGTGKMSLYTQLFLSRSLLRTDPVFDHPLGRYLTDPDVSIKEHLLALQGALGLTAGEIGSILEANARSSESTLSIANVSLLYRYGLLAKALKISVDELIVLKQLSGLDPFKKPFPEPLTNAAAVPPPRAISFDFPFSQTLRFVDVVQEVRDSGLKIEDLDYLLRHRFDETGKYRPNHEGTLALLKTLADGVSAIGTELSVPLDPAALNEDGLRQMLGRALVPEVVERLLGMITETTEFTAAKTGVELPGQLQRSKFSNEERVIQVSYKEVPNKEQKLTWRGVLLEPQKAALETKYAIALNPAQVTVFAALLQDVQIQARDFFDNHLKKQQLRTNGEAGFLEGEDLDSLFLPLKPHKPFLTILPSDNAEQRDAKLANNERIREENDTSDQENQKEVQKRRHRIAQAFLPFLQQRLIRQFIVQTLTAYTGADPVLVASLLTDERLLVGKDHQSLLHSFAATSLRGVSAEFYDSANLSGAPQAARSVVAGPETALKDTVDTNGNALGRASSARFEGYLEVPATGAYRFYVCLDKRNAKAALTFPELANQVVFDGTATKDNDELGTGASEFVELRAGIPYRFKLDLRNLNGGEARMLVQGETTPKESVAQLRLYPLVVIQPAEHAVTLLTKALQLVEALGLSEREIRYILTNAADFGGFSLSELPTQPTDNTDAARVRASERFARFLRIAGYVRLKRELAGGTADLIKIFEATGRGDEETAYKLLATITRRELNIVGDTAKYLFDAPEFSSEKPLMRLWEALQIVDRFGVPVTSIVAWTGIVDLATTPAKRFEIARDLKSAIKARFEPDVWQRVAQPIFDKLRRRQRDALVSHVMHQHGFANVNELYEYFLIDPGTEPVVQTSRIRLAISSVQLFIQRCLLNLELQVHPSTINSQHWEWKKRYRVWEANRKIFLFPENWLEPEFRDDKTHLFAELEGALLQGDVSSDLVEDALLNYLKKLDELARLDIVGMHIEDGPDPAHRTLHVIGRTYGLPHKYFYRRHVNDTWTAWEPVSAEIEGDHLAPVVWRDRLYLFWVTFMDKAVENPSPTPERPPSDFGVGIESEPVKERLHDKQMEIQLHWSEYLQGQWSTRESGESVMLLTEGAGIVTASGTIPSFAPTILAINFNKKNVSIHVSKEVDAGEERGVYVHLGEPFNQSFYLAGRNNQPERKYENGQSSTKPPNPYSSANSVDATRYKGSDTLQVTIANTPETILLDGNAYTLVPCDNNLSNGEANATLTKPVFYQDNRHTLFVEPEVTERLIDGRDVWVDDQETPDLRNVDDRLKGLLVVPGQPGTWPFPEPGEPFPTLGPDGSLINPRRGDDWFLNSGTVFVFDNGLIGPFGRPGLELVTREGASSFTDGRSAIHVNPSGAVPSGSVVVATGSASLESAGLKSIPGGLSVVGGSGFNSGLEQNFNDARRSNFGDGSADSVRLERTVKGGAP